MELLTFNKAREIWSRVIKSPEEIPLSFDLSVHKKLLNLFHVGEYYYYIFNCSSGTFDYLDENASAVTGYSYQALSPQFIYTKVHPDDIRHVLEHENTITSFYEQLPIDDRLNYKSSYDYRVRFADGQYKRILQQVTAIQVGDDGSVFRTFGVHTDITHIKPEGFPRLSLMDIDGRLIEISDNITSTQTLYDGVSLSVRECEIVKLISQGKSTREIAQILCISTHTVQTHRRNILSKTKAKSTGELVHLAIINGWI